MSWFLLFVLKYVYLHFIYNSALYSIIKQIAAFELCKMCCFVFQIDKNIYGLERQCLHNI